MPAPEHHQFVKELLGVDPNDYDVSVVQARHHAMATVMGRIMHDGAQTKEGGRLIGIMRSAFAPDMHKNQMGTVEVWIDLYAKGNRDALKKANSLLSYAHDVLIQYSRAEAAAPKPGIFDTAYATYRITEDQFRAEARTAEGYYEEFQKHHLTLFTIINGTYQTWKDLAVFKDCYDLFNDTNLFVKSVEAQEAVAAASSVLSPVGPGAVILCMVGEFITLFLEFINVVMELIAFFEKLASGNTKQMEPILAEMGALKGGAEALNVKKKLDGWRKDLHRITDLRDSMKEMKGGLEKCRKAGKALHDLLHGAH